MPVTWTISALGGQWSTTTEPGKRTGTVVYQAIASEPSTPAAAEVACAAAPSAGVGLTIGSVYPGDAGSLRCIKRDAKPTDQTRTMFIVTAEYDSSVTVEENPLAIPMRVDYQPEDTTETYFEDCTSPTPKTPVNTAGQPFSDLPQRDAGVLVIRITRNVDEDENYGDYEAFIQPKVNDDVVTIDGRGYAAGTLKASPPQLSAVKEMNGVEYRELSITLKAKETGWDQKFESRGIVEKIGDDLTPIADSHGVPVTEPWPLDADGAGLPLASSTPAVVTLKPYESADFSVLF